MTIGRMVGVLLGSSLLIQGVSHAEMRTEWTVGPSAMIPVGRTGDVEQNGGGFITGVVVSGDIGIGLGAELGYSRQGIEGSDADLDTLRFTPVLATGAPIGEIYGGTLIPYLMVGGGYYRTHISDGLGTFTNGGFLAGGGISYRHAPWVVAADVRYHQILFDNATDRKLLEPSLQVGWVF